MKVKLENRQSYLNRIYAFNKNCGQLSIKESLPFYKSRRGEYIHRVRNGAIHLWKGVYKHTVVGLWCGAHGFLGKKGTLLESIPIEGVVCATCEGRAIGAGLFGAPRINGRTVKYSPRIK